MKWFFMLVAGIIAALMSVGQFGGEGNVGVRHVDGGYDVTWSSDAAEE